MKIIKKAVILLILSIAVAFLIDIISLIFQFRDAPGSLSLAVFCGIPLGVLFGLILIQKFFEQNFSISSIILGVIFAIILSIASLFIMDFFHSSKIAFFIPIMVLCGALVGNELGKK